MKSKLVGPLVGMSLVGALAVGVTLPSGAAVSTSGAGAGPMQVSTSTPTPKATQTRRARPTGIVPPTRPPVQSPMDARDE